jgi:hypothetical protein
MENNCPKCYGKLSYVASPQGTISHLQCNDCGHKESMDSNIRRNLVWTKTGKPFYPVQEVLHKSRYDIAKET